MNGHREIRLVLGDCSEKMQDIPIGTIDAIISDPPYGLEFMSQDWDAPWKSWQSGGGFSKPGIGERPTQWPSFSATSKHGAVNPTCNTCGGRARGKNRCLCPEPQWKPIGKRRKIENEGLPSDMTSSGMQNHLRAFQSWCELWSAECFRILKPNGIIKAFSGTRTHHRMAQALKKSGFVDFQVHAWTYGSGFPKSMNVGKAVDALLLTGGSDSRRIKQANALRPGEAREATFLPINGIKSTTRSSSNLVNDNPATEAANQWSGYGTALKPAWEPIIVARKPT
jgi:hypothetical protein